MTYDAWCRPVIRRAESKRKWLKVCNYQFVDLIYQLANSSLNLPFFIFANDELKIINFTNLNTLWISRNKNGRLLKWRSILHLCEYVFCTKIDRHSPKNNVMMMMIRRYGSRIYLKYVSITIKMFHIRENFYFNIKGHLRSNVYNHSLTKSWHNHFCMKLMYKMNNGGHWRNEKWFCADIPSSLVVERLSI